MSRVGSVYSIRTDIVYVRVSDDFKDFVVDVGDDKKKPDVVLSVFSDIVIIPFLRYYFRVEVVLLRGFEVLENNTRFPRRI